MNFCQARRSILASPYAKSHVQSNLTNPVLWDHATVQVSESLYCYCMAVDHVLSSDLLFGGSSFPQNRAFRHKASWSCSRSWRPISYNNLLPESLRQSSSHLFCVLLWVIPCTACFPLWYSAKLLSRSLVSSCQAPLRELQREWAGCPKLGEQVARLVLTIPNLINIDPRVVQ